MNRTWFWPDLGQPFVYVVFDRPLDRYYALGHRCQEGGGRRDLDYGVLGRTMSERHVVIPAFPTGQQGDYANFLMLDIDYHQSVIDPGDEEWLRLHCPDGILWPTSNQGLRYLEAFTAVQPVRELEAITEYIQDHLNGKVDVRSYQPGKYLTVPTRYRKDGWDLGTLWSDHAPRLQQMLTETAEPIVPDRRTEPSPLQSSSITLNNDQKLLAAPTEGPRRPGRPAGLVEGSRRAVRAQRDAKSARLEATLPVDLRTSIAAYLEWLRAHAKDEVSVRVIQKADLAMLKVGQAVNLDQQVPKGQWNGIMNGLTPTMPLVEVEPWVRARSTGLDEKTIEDRIRRTTHLLEHRTSSGLPICEDFVAKLVALVLDLLPKPARGGRPPRELHAQRIYVGTTLFAMAYRSRLADGDFFLTILTLARATGFLAQHRDLDLATAYELFRISVLSKAKQVFPVLTDADGQPVQEKVEEYANQRHGMNVYTRSEAAQELVDLLGPVPHAARLNQQPGLSVADAQPEQHEPAAAVA